MFPFLENSYNYSLGEQPVHVSKLMHAWGMRKGRGEKVGITGKYGTSRVCVYIPICTAGKLRKFCLEFTVC